MGRLIPLIGAAAVALLIGGAAGWLLFAPAPAEDASAAAPAAGAATFIYPVRERIVNLADPGARRFLKVSLALEVPERAADAARRKAPPTPDEQRRFQQDFGHRFDSRIQDVLTTVLTAKRADEVSTTEGRERLLQELKARINAFLPKDQQVTNVYLVDFIIQ